MGGPGSGRWHRWDARSTVEDYLCIDVRYLSRKGLLHQDALSTLTWTNQQGQLRGSAQVRAETGCVALTYRCSVGFNDRQVANDTIPLTWTSCAYGGRRPWFVCPGGVNGASCGRRVAILYGPGSRFRCRHCYRLAYDSQRVGPAKRNIRKTQRIRERLGGSANLLEPFPSKPKGMHWSTYWRLRFEARETEQQYLASMKDELDRMAARAKGSGRCR